MQLGFPMPSGLEAMATLAFEAASHLTSLECYTVQLEGSLTKDLDLFEFLPCAF